MCFENNNTAQSEGPSEELIVKLRCRSKRKAAMGASCLVEVVQADRLGGLRLGRAA